jgi:protein involved in polysaccharide export with SLBB domain
MSSRSSSKFRRAITRLCLVCAVSLASCADDGSSAPPFVLRQQADGLSRTYRLGVGDKLKVNVFGEPDLSGTFEVAATGHVAMPLIGDIPAQGRPIADFREAVARKLSEGYLKQPKITVEILNYRPIYVHGEVRSGGEFPFKSGLKLRDAIAVAGGYTYRANLSYVLLAREGEPQEMKVALPSDLDVLPGDNIRIPERFF